jgi:uncharacterized glyoxalase superfamily protein PhnB
MSLPNLLTAVLLASASLACGNDTVESSPAQEPPGAQVPVTAEPSSPMATVQRVTPILAVEAIEPVVPFWEALGFTTSNPNYTDGKLVFLEFNKDGFQVHYQTLERIERNTPAAAEALRGSAALVYVTVDDLDGIVERLGGTAIVVPRQRTAWGSDEIYVREPAGHIIGFSAFGN